MLDGRRRHASPAHPAAKKCHACARSQAVWILMEPMWFWSHARTQWPQAMGGNCGNSAGKPQALRSSTSSFMKNSGEGMAPIARFCLCRQRLPNGQIANTVGKKCVGAAGDAVILTSCDEGSTWETQANGTHSQTLCLPLELCGFRATPGKGN